MERVFVPTARNLDQIADDLDFCSEFAYFLLMLGEYCTTFITIVSHEQVALYVQSAMWCCSHPEPGVAEFGIRIVNTLLGAIENRLAAQFVIDFQNCFGLPLLFMAFELLSDSVHKYAVMQLIALVRRLIHIPNMMSKISAIVEWLSETFPNRSPMDHYGFVTELARSTVNYNDFRNTVRNFLVECHKFSPKDPSLFALEKEEVERRIKEKRDIPGLVVDIPEVGMCLSNLAELVHGFCLRR
jgi:hypothetical protein